MCWLLIRAVLVITWPTNVSDKMTVKRLRESVFLTFCYSHVIDWLCQNIIKTHSLNLLTVLLSEALVGQAKTRMALICLRSYLMLSDATSVNPQTEKYLRRSSTNKHNKHPRCYLGTLGWPSSPRVPTFPTRPLSLTMILWMLRNSVSKLRSKRAKQKHEENTCEHYWLCS